MMPSTAGAFSPTIHVTSSIIEWRVGSTRLRQPQQAPREDTMTMSSMISGAKQKLKGGLNQALGNLGYRLVRAETLDRLTTAQHPAANEASKEPGNDKPAPQPRQLTLLPAANKAPAVCTALAPKFDPRETPSQLADKILAFQQEGVTVISTSPEK